MSEKGRFAIIPHALFANGSAREIAVYGALALHADENGQCWPSAGRLAELAGISVPTVHKALDRLVELGAVTRVVRRRPDGGQTSNLYVLHAWGLARRAQEREHEQPEHESASRSESVSVSGEGDPSKDSLGGVERNLIPPSKDSLDELYSYELDPVNNPMHTSPDGDSVLIPDPPKPDTPKPRRYSDEFEQWWKCYPVKRGKPRAYEAFKKARKRASLETLTQGAIDYAGWVKANPDRSPKWAQGWLNDDRWEDDLGSGYARPRSTVGSWAQTAQELSNGGLLGINPGTWDGAP